MVALAEGDLPGARAVVGAALGTVEPTALLTFFGIYWDLYWVLDDAQQQQLLTFPPAPSMMTGQTGPSCGPRRTGCATTRLKRGYTRTRHDLRSRS